MDAGWKELWPKLRCAYRAGLSAVAASVLGVGAWTATMTTARRPWQPHPPPPPAPPPAAAAVTTWRHNSHYSRRRWARFLVDTRLGIPSSAARLKLPAHRLQPLRTHAAGNPTVQMADVRRHVLRAEHRRARLAPQQARHRRGERRDADGRGALVAAAAPRVGGLRDPRSLLVAHRREAARVEAFVPAALGVEQAEIACRRRVRHRAVALEAQQLRLRLLRAASARSAEGVGVHLAQQRTRGQLTRRRCCYASRTEQHIGTTIRSLSKSVLRTRYWRKLSERSSSGGSVSANFGGASNAWPAGSRANG